MFTKSITAILLTALAAMLLTLVAAAALRRHASDRFVERVRRRWRDAGAESG